MRRDSGKHAAFPLAFRFRIYADPRDIRHYRARTAVWQYCFPALCHFRKGPGIILHQECSRWQVAPQLDGVEYCPIHRIRIRNSNISLKGIRHHFYPASLSVSPLPCTSEYHDLFSEERELFIKIACSINQILISGPAYEGLEKLQLAYSNAVGGSDNYHWFSFNEMIWHSFSRYPTKDALYDYLLDKTSETCFETTQSFSKVAPCIHVLLMTVFSGDPQAFYS